MLHKYNSLWPIYYHQETEYLKKFGKCHHIGSTAIPSMISKNCIDIMLIVPKSFNELEGFTFKGQFNIPGRNVFDKKTPNYSVHIHMIEPDHAFIDLQLKFKKYLLDHPQTRKEYSHLKQSIINNHPNCFTKNTKMLKPYTILKNSFIKKIIHQSGFDQFIINWAIMPEEKQFCDKYLGHNENCIILYKGINMLAATDFKNQHGAIINIEIMNKLIKRSCL